MSVLAEIGINEFSSWRTDKLLFYAGLLPLRVSGETENMLVR